MNSRLEHQDCLESLGAYALGALPEPEATYVQEHLRTCRECQAQFEWLRVAADALPASVPVVAPPPELRGRVMAVVNREAELLRAAGAGADRPPATRREPRWPRLTWISPRPAAALALAAAVAAAVVILVGGGTGGRTVPGHVLLGPGKASLTITGTRAQLTVRGLPLPAANHVDEVWVVHGSSSPRPAGLFVLRSGTVQVQQPVRRGDKVLVTVEPGRGTRAPTTKPFVFAQA